MANEIENADSPNGADEQELDNEDIDTDDPQALKEALEKTQGLNKQLFERAKKAEGFELKDGKWVKKPAPPKPEPPKPATPPSGFSKEDAERLLDEKMNERDLRSLDLSDELKEEVRTLAKVKGISYLEASKAPYILHLKGEEEQKARATKAAIPPKAKGSTATRTFSKDTKASDFDMKDPVQREAYKDWVNSRQ